jgi:hypothetical protein
MICRLQSGFSFLTSFTFLVHSALTFDLHTNGVRAETTTSRARQTKAEIDLEASEPFRLEMFCVPLFYHMVNCYRRLVQFCRGKRQTRQSISDPM